MSEFEEAYKNLDKNNNQPAEIYAKQETTAENVIDIFKDIVSVQKHNQSYDQLLQVYTNHINKVLS